MFHETSSVKQVFYLAAVGKTDEDMTPFILKRKPLTDLLNNTAITWEFYPGITSTEDCISMRMTHFKSTQSAIMKKLTELGRNGVCIEIFAIWCYGLFETQQGEAFANVINPK